MTFRPTQKNVTTRKWNRKKNTKLKTIYNEKNILDNIKKKTTITKHAMKSKISLLLTMLEQRPSGKRPTKKKQKFDGKIKLKKS